MTSARDKLDQIELDRQRDEALEALQKQHVCHVCQMQGITPTQNKCSHCGGDGIEPDEREVYQRGVKEINEHFAR